MQFFLVALLALPAVLAAPAPAVDDPWPTTFPISSFACSCTDGGSRSTIGPCLYLPGIALGDYCAPAVAWSPHMEDYFTNDLCVSNDPTMPKAQCIPIKLCKSTLANDPKYFQIC
ncbi:hypothetical protein B0O99DRAFT_597756 [Bisporella sp. PMI_857]|nr:hypothetical protein B0O99DRAFT_597756 [Bisporella sp. PMI_857]